MSDVIAVLVPGALADSAGWNGALQRLAAQGVTAVAVANPDGGQVGSGLRCH